MYEYKGKLLERTEQGFVGVTLEILEGESYRITNTDERYASRPSGATPTTVENLIIRHGLVVGDMYPAQVKPAPAQPKGAAKQTD